MNHGSFFDDLSFNRKKLAIEITPEPITPSRYIIFFDKFSIRGKTFGSYKDRYLLLTDGWLHIYKV